MYKQQGIVEGIVALVRPNPKMMEENGQAFELGEPRRGSDVRSAVKPFLWRVPISAPPASNAAPPRAQSLDNSTRAHATPKSRALALLCWHIFGHWPPTREDRTHVYA
jgi:hypothetical protein